MANSAKDAFRFPKSYGFPPMWTLQRTLATRHEQFKRWSNLILAYCHHHRIWRLTLVDALNTPLFRNSKLRKSLTLEEVTEILDWMTQEQGMRRAEWIGREGSKGSAWIYWRRPEEWADVIVAWVEQTGQKNVVLTLYELTDGEAAMSQEFHGMDPELLQKALQLLVKRGKAQIFGSDDQQGIKFT